MLRPGGQEVNAGSLNTGMAQQVGQLHDVPAGPVEDGGEQVAQVVGKHLGGFHPGVLAEGFQLRPDLPAAQLLSASGAKDRAGGDFLLLGVFAQLTAQLAGEQDGADLSLEGDFRLALLHGLHGDIPHLGHPDAGGPDGLHQQGQPFPAQPAGSVQQALVVLFRQFPIRVLEQPPLELEEFDLAGIQSQVLQQAVQGREHGVDAGRGVVFLHQMGFPLRGQLLVDLPSIRPDGEGMEIPQVFVIFVVDNDMDADERESFGEAAEWFEQKGIEPEAAFLRMTLTPDYDHLEKYLHTLWKEEPEIRRRWLEIHRKQHYMTEWLVRTYTIRELIRMSPDEILPSLHWNFTAAYRELRTALEEKDWEKIWSMGGMFNATSLGCSEGIRIYLEKQEKGPEDISRMSDLELAYLLFVGAINLQGQDLSVEEEHILCCTYEEYRKREQTVPWGNLWARKIALYLANQKDALTLMSSSDDYHAFLPTEEHSYLYQARPLLSQELKELTPHVIWMLQEIKEEHAIFRVLPALLICSVKTEWALPSGRYRRLLSIHCSEPLKELGRLLFLMMVPDWNLNEIKELGSQIVCYLGKNSVQDTLLFLRLGETYDAERSVKDPIYQDIYEYLMRPEYDGDEMAEKSRSRLCELARQKIESGKRRIVGDDI